MTYELAKKLKDAGFPQTGNGYLRVFDPADAETVYKPTLEELIEALPAFFDFRLGYRLNVGPEERKAWEAKGGWKNWSIDRYDEYQGTGENPSEAVANLWLALNKKDGNNQKQEVS